MAEERRAEGRELAWQSMQEVGCAVREAWSFCVVAQLGDAVAVWQSSQLCGMAGVAVGAVPLQTTASCFISPEGGVLAGLPAGPTKPVGAEPRWQSRQWTGCARFMLVNEAWRFPGKRPPGSVWQLKQDAVAAGGSAALR